MVPSNGEGRSTRMPAAGASTGRRWAVLAVLCVSLFVVSVDNTILNVALPTIVRVLHASSGDLQWTMDAYAVVFAGLLLTTGSLGDRFGRKRVFIAGLVVFGAGSAMSAFSATPHLLVAARAFMGIGAAAIMPATLSILTDVFRDDASRARAIGIWSGTTGLGMAVGPIAGGWLLAHYWWGSVFLVNVPVVVLGLLAALWLVPDSRDPAAPRPDPLGAVLSTAGLGLVLWGIIDAPSSSWTSPAVLATTTAGILVLVTFVAWERRCDHAMLDLSFFSAPRFSAAMSALALVVFALMGMLFILTQWLQFSLGLSPLATGLRIGPIALVLVVAAPLSTALAHRFGSKAVVASGMATIALGLALLSRTGTTGSYGAAIPALLLIGVGSGLAFAPCTESVMGSLPHSRSGVGAATNSAGLQVGGALGVGVLGSVLDTRYVGHVAPVLVGRHLPAGVEQLIVGSLGGALAVAGHVGGPIGSALATVARRAFVDGMDLALLTGSFAAIVGVAVVAIALPGWSPDAALDRRGQSEAGTARLAGTGAGAARGQRRVPGREPSRLGAALPRVVLEMPDADLAVASMRSLAGSGYDVTWCPGPAGPPRQPCSLVTTGRCALLDGAHAVVSVLDGDEPSSHQVLRALSDRASSIPLVVTGSGARRGGVTGSFTELTSLSGPDLVAAVGRAIDGR